MTEADITAAFTALPGVVAIVASRHNGAPEVSWGDTFFCYDPDNTGEHEFPFATIVTKDYPDFDTASNLDRPGVHRLNLAAGRAHFTELFGFAPTDFATHRDRFDFTALGTRLPHPVYAPQSWIAILNPTLDAPTRALITHAHARARSRHHRRG